MRRKPRPTKETLCFLFEGPLSRYRTTNIKPTTFQQQRPLLHIRGPAFASRNAHPQIVDEDEERSEREADQAHNGQRGDLQRRHGLAVSLGDKHLRGHQ
jgi:hypothetical protein